MIDILIPGHVRVAVPYFGVNIPLRLLDCFLLVTPAPAEVLTGLFAAAFLIVGEGGLGKSEGDGMVTDAAM